MSQQLSSETNAGLTESRFAMWRAVVALCHADGMVHEEEKRFIRKFYKIVGFTDVQKKMLEAGLEAADDINTILPDITDPQDRAELLFFARMLFWSDGNMAEQEKKLLELLRDNAIERKDLDKSVEMTMHSNREQELKALDAARMTTGIRPVLGQLIQRLHGINLEDSSGPVKD